ncbi:MAG: DCC1-like thiol-disulfide oxidoreductase family protein [Rickettsiales bacterium]|nr:DCC1-like thiol-disulfide oxidoreductase family protein [Rickettsiales bacterium]
MSMLTVYYDGKCGLCNKEIRYYQRIAPVGVFLWVDVTQKADDFVAKGYLYLMA